MFHDFVAKCLTKEPRLRPTASEMLKVCSALLEFTKRLGTCGTYLMLSHINPMFMSDMIF